MRVPHVLLPISLGATLIAGPGPIPAVRAEVVTVARYGAWQAYSGVADDGKRVCGIGETGADGRTFNIKYFEGANNFEIVIGKPAWAIPAGIHADVAITFDRATPWRGSARGSGIYLFLSLPLERLLPFEAEFKQAYSMIVSFPGGSEAPWRGNLSGSTAISGQMAECVRLLVASGGGPATPTAPPGATTQPFGGAASQPFGSPSRNDPSSDPSQSASTPEFPSVKGVPAGGSVKQ